jgi:hypothetical protein
VRMTRGGRRSRSARPELGKQRDSHAAMLGLVAGVRHHP